MKRSTGQCWLTLVMRGWRLRIGHTSLPDVLPCNRDQDDDKRDDGERRRGIVRCAKRGAATAVKSESGGRKEFDSVDEVVAVCEKFGVRQVSKGDERREQLDDSKASRGRRLVLKRKVQKFEPRGEVGQRGV